MPPLRSNEGYRATEWGDLAQPMWKGRMRIVETSKGVTIQLEDSQTGSLRALCLLVACRLILRQAKVRESFTERDWCPAPYCVDSVCSCAVRCFEALG